MQNETQTQQPTQLKQPLFHDIGGLKIGAVPIELLKQRRTNYRKMDESAYKALQQSVAKFGFKSFVVVVEDKGQYEVVDGHHRWQAAKDANMTQIPVVLLEGQDPNAIDLAMLSFNVQAEVIPDVYLDFLKDLSMRVGSETLASFTGLDDGFLKDLTTTLADVKMGNIDLGGGASGDETGADRSRGFALNIPLPSTPEVEALVKWAMERFKAPTPADAMIAALRALRALEAP